MSCMLHVQTPSQDSTGSVGTDGIMPVGQPSQSLPYFGERCGVLGAYAIIQKVGKVSKPICNLSSSLAVVNFC